MTQNVQQNEQQELLKIEEVAARLGVSISTIRRGVNVPQPVSIGARGKRWSRAAVEAWMGQGGRAMSIRALIEAVERGEFITGILQSHETVAYAAFSGSLDAALALHEALLPGLFPGMSKNVHHGHWFAWVQTKEGNHRGTATEPDPARAWLLAILRAVETKGGAQ